MAKTKKPMVKGKTLALTMALAVVAALTLFILSSPAKSNLEGRELQRVNALLTLLETKTDLLFERNGTEYNVDRAVKHLKSKLKSAGDEISTAQQFIDRLASKSSMSGKPYYVIMPNKERVEAREFFYGLLKEVDSNLRS
ncbi:MAG: DUF5329 domain-containing protein [Deltaproteobacteria bacterium]|jgi:hypothetical protein|nr:DUF5329 domain-containing protein [Deltaproteobacteria bacterium]